MTETAQGGAASVSADEEKRYAELQVMALDFARSGECHELEKMLEAGLPVNLADHRGNTLLMLAAYNEQPEVVELLLRYSADVDRRNERGQTPLGGVAFKGYDAICKLLLEAGADRDADNGGGATPLMFAEMFGRTTTARLLRQHGATHGRRRVLGVLTRILSTVVGCLRR